MSIAVGFLLTLLMEFGGRSRRTERIVEREGRPVEREDVREHYQASPAGV